MCAVFASSLFKSAEMSLDEGHFGLFDTAWNMPYEAQQLVSTHAVNQTGNLPELPTHSQHFPSLPALL
jgi:hypothetical protein